MLNKDVEFWVVVMWTQESHDENDVTFKVAAKKNGCDNELIAKF